MLGADSVSADRQILVNGQRREDVAVCGTKPRPAATIWCVDRPVTSRPPRANLARRDADEGRRSP